MQINIQQLRYFDASLDPPCGAEDAIAASRYATTQRRAQCLAGRRLVRRQLENATRIPAEAWRLLANENGRPYPIDPAGQPGPDVSIGHSGPFVAAALTTIGRIGLDIERPRAHRSTLAISRTVFSAEEQRSVEREGESAFLRFWTLREAIGKVIGTGLIAGLAVDGATLVSILGRCAAMRIGTKDWILGSRELENCTLSVAWALGDQRSDAALERLTAALAEIRLMPPESFCHVAA